MAIRVRHLAEAPANLRRGVHQAHLVRPLRPGSRSLLKILKGICRPYRSQHHLPSRLLQEPDHAAHLGDTPISRA